MARLIYGKRGKNGPFTFDSLYDFYFFLGILTGQKHTKIAWEKNDEQGAWGSEGRVQIYSDLDFFPQGVIKRATAGVGNIKHRVNSNDFVIDLLENHSFCEIQSYGRSTSEIVPTSKLDVQYTVPEEYLEIFNEGLTQ